MSLLFVDLTPDLDNSKLLSLGANSSIAMPILLNYNLDNSDMDSVGIELEADGHGQECIKRNGGGKSM